MGNCRSSASSHNDEPHHNPPKDPGCCLLVTTADQETIQRAEPLVPPNENAKATIAVVLGEEGSPDLIRHILSFLLPSPTGTPCALPALQRKRLRKSIQSSLAVCRSWNQAAWKCISPSIPGVVSSSTLATIKKQVVHVDLDFLGDQFTQEIEKLISAHSFELSKSEKDVVWTEINQSPLQRDKMIRWYKMFLVIKAVECHAEKIPSNPQVAVWKEKCQPFRALDIMWHAHMLAPRVYLEHCRLLAGKGLDHTEGYISPSEVPKSDLKSKVEVVFRSEAMVNEFARFYPELGQTPEIAVDSVIQSLFDNVCCG
ncbi:expressed unknown protein [Seminavis robusta]|uniref:F-box domain-containing protein n=1 Tax=Seminavis robusta TaxID=568900 RepID=A0A9N8D9H1_9STRA|nr:expressed unknown protein [Seminavis robusta]|eukprot:Sro52_g030850.1 n/a (313) ;mRNA; r:17661-18599